VEVRIGERRVVVRIRVFMVSEWEYCGGVVADCYLVASVGGGNAACRARVSICLLLLHLTLHTTVPDHCIGQTKKRIG